MELSTNVWQSRSLRRRAWNFASVPDAKCSCNSAHAASILRICPRMMSRSETSRATFFIVGKLEQTIACILSPISLRVSNVALHLLSFRECTHVQNDVTLFRWAYEVSCRVRAESTPSANARNAPRFWVPRFERCSNSALVNSTRLQPNLSTHSPREQAKITGSAG